MEVRLAGPGVVRLAELDTSWFVGNAPGWASLRGWDARSGDDARLVELLPRTRLQPDTPHRFRLDAAPEVTHVRLDMLPDGGMARLRLMGVLAPAGREQLILRWFNLLPPAQATEVLTAEGVPADVAEATLAARPLGRADTLPDGIRTSIGV